MKLIVSSKLGYELQKPTNFIFQVHAAKTATQTVKSETFEISTNPSIASFEASPSLNRLRVHANLAYEPGSTGPHSTAADALRQGKGVCRDFAHLAIAVARAAGLPARYASVYADGMSPPDFHAVPQFYLQSPDGGAWFTVDPTRMSSADAIARISVGRDTADVAFAWTAGNVDSTAPQVTASAPDRADKLRTQDAIACE